MTAVKIAVRHNKENKSFDYKLSIFIDTQGDSEQTGYLMQYNCSYVFS